METFGWDTLAVVRTDVVNRQLATHREELLIDFRADPGTDPPVVAEGRFASWCIAPGGAEQLLRLALEIERGTLTIGAGTLPELAQGMYPYVRSPAAVSDQLEEYDLAGATVVVAVDLRLLNDANSIEQELVFRLETVGTSLPPPGPGYVTPVTVIDPRGALGIKAKTLLGYAIATDLVANAERVNYVLGRVNPVPPGVDSWLAPTDSAYAYAARETEKEGCLAILSVTGGRNASALRPMVDPAALQGSATGSYVISGDMVLKHVIRPILANAYATTADAFRLDEAAHALREARTFPTATVKSGALTYQPEITFFEMRISGSALRTELRGRCNLKAGIWMQFSVSVVNATRFDASTKTLSFVSDDNPRYSYSADIPWYLGFLGALAASLMDSVVRLISRDVAMKFSDLTRTALSILQQPPQIVEWTGIKGFNVAAAGLDSALFMMGATTS